MRTRRWKPHPAEISLLQACLCEDPETALKGFNAWRSFQEKSQLVHAERLFPLFVAASSRHGWKDPEIESVRERLRSISMFSSIVAMHAAKLIKELQEQGREVLILKGLALQDIAYPASWMRPVTDCDILLTPSEANSTVGFLTESGWTTRAKLRFGPGQLAGYAGANYARGMYEQIDVHWRLNYWSRDPDLENRMRRRAIAMTIGGTKTKTLDHTDHLLHALAHGVAWEGGGTVTRWVADSVYLARSGIIDWDRLVDDAVRSGFGPQAREGLRFLVEQSFVEVPWSTIAALERTRPDPIAELAHWARNSPPTPASMLCRLFVTDYPARSAGQPMLQRIRGYPGYIVRTISDENDSRMSGLLTGLRRGPTDRSFRAPKTK